MIRAKEEWNAHVCRKYLKINKLWKNQFDVVWGETGVEIAGG
jgi:hypothetical protein